MPPCCGNAWLETGLLLKSTDPLGRMLACQALKLRASAEETALMMLGALAAQDNYPEITIPVATVAGEDNRMVTARDQLARLHERIPQSTFELLPGTWHLVHQTATEAVPGAGDSVGIAT